MSDCLKGKKEIEPAAGAFQCKKCGGVAEKKGRICKPEKIHGKDEKTKKKKNKKKGK